MSIFDKIKSGLEKAIAYEKGELSTDIGHYNQRTDRQIISLSFSLKNQNMVPTERACERT